MNHNLSFITNTNTSVDEGIRTMTVYSESCNGNLNRITAIKTLLECSRAAGGYVKFLPEISYLPTLIDAASKAVYMYQFVELIDELLDYDEIIEECPTLSYAQVGSALSFLRKVCQINAKSVDIDDLENAFVSDNEALIEEIRQSLADEELIDVFSAI